MAEDSFAPYVNSQALGQAIAEARGYFASDCRWLNAVNRSVLNLSACKWQFDGKVFIVEPAGTGEVVEPYFVTEETCECKAFAHDKPCWHRAAFWIVSRATQIATLPLPEERCPSCGKRIKAAAYNISGKPYLYFEVCGGDGVHLLGALEDEDPTFKNVLVADSSEREYVTIPIEGYREVIAALQDYMDTDECVCEEKTCAGETCLACQWCKGRRALRRLGEEAFHEPR